jgi:hypothetical protein
MVDAVLPGTRGLACAQLEQSLPVAEPPLFEATESKAPASNTLIAESPNEDAS